MKRHIIEVGGAIMLCLAAYLSYSVVSSLPVLSLATELGRDVTFSDLAPDWIHLPRMATEMAGVAHLLRGAMHRRGVDAMNFRLLAQSLVFVTAALIVTAVLAMALRFEIARLLFAIGVAGIWLIAEIYVAIKVALGLWE